MAKTAKVEARVAPEEDEFLRWAAQTSGVSLSAFVVQAALREARQLQERERLTVLPAEFAEQFYSWLDAPTDPSPAMKRLAEAERFPTRDS